MADLKAWPKPTGVPEELPKPVLRPCDFGLMGAVTDLETQLGTIEAYNRLVSAARVLKTRIEAGDVKAQNPMYAMSVRGDPEVYRRNMKKDQKS